MSENKLLKFAKKHKIECIAMLVYIVGISVISYFHEPWFDEAQAWQIARSDSIKDILFKIPHWEGHPQLWHLLLVPFAKLGAPYLFSLKFVNTVICSTAVSLLIFKSPFPKLLRCALPFTYFIFYQYGVISRPYCIMMLAIFLMAVTYKNRDEKPLPFVLSMALLCASQMMGIVIAGMVSVVWVVKIFASHADDKKAVFKDKRCYALLGLLVIAAVFIISVMPHKETFNLSLDAGVFDRLKLLYTMLFIPFEALWGMFVSYETEEVYSVSIAILESICGIAVMLGISYFGKKAKMLSEFLVPCTALLLFMTLGYSSPHHYGIVTLCMIYFFWILIDQNGTAVFTDLAEKAKTKISSAFMKKLAAVLMAAALILPIAQSIGSSVLDIKYPFTYSKEMEEYIKEHGLQDVKIMNDWLYSYDTSDMSSEELKSANENSIRSRRSDYTYIMSAATEVSPYFDKNIFMNFGEADGSGMYTQYRKNDDAKARFSEWHDKGLPDMIVNEIALDMIYTKDELKTVHYVRVAEFKGYKIFKFTKAEYSINLYMRKDLLDKYGLKELPF